MDPEGKGDFAQQNLAEATWALRTKVLTPSYLSVHLEWGGSSLECPGDVVQVLPALLAPGKVSAADKSDSTPGGGRHPNQKVRSQKRNMQNSPCPPSLEGVACQEASHSPRHSCG